MNILIITGHPAQVHNFKLLKNELESLGHQVFWMATNKDISKYLLDYYNIKYTVLEKTRKSFFSKIMVLFKNTYKCFRFIEKHKIDFIISRVSPYASIAAYIKRKPHIALADTETSGIYDTIFTKLVSVFITAKSFKRTLRSDQIRIDSNIELFYLHSKRFQPTKDISGLLGITQNEPYVILRFVSWDAYHDKGLSGFTDENKIKAVNGFSKFAKVFISSEKKLPESLEPYCIKVPPEKMHDVLAHATLFFGESATMASESAVLGTPAIYLNENWLGYTDEEEKFGLLYSFKQDEESQEKAILKGLELISVPDLKKLMHEHHKKFLMSKIDATGFMVWFIENYPKSISIMKENPNYQLNFR